MNKQWRRWFPRLKAGQFAVTSPITRAYNCLAFAALDDTRVWDPATAPSGQSAFFWPAGVVGDGSIGSWVQVLKTLGFQACNSGSELDPSLLKVAIFGHGGKAMHAARQLQSGAWVSKLGDLEDICHAKPEDVGGGIYGEIMMIVARARTPQDP